MALDRTNVIPFGKTPTQPAPQPDSTASKQELQPEASAAPGGGAAKRAAGTVAGGIIGALRYIVFLALLWLRVPLRFIFGIVGGLSTFGLLGTLALWAFAVESHPVLPKASLILGVISFVSITFMWLYDSLLMRLSPETSFLT